MEKLLVCIAFYNVPERVKYVQKIIERIRTYAMDVDIIVDVNSNIELDANVCVHIGLDHPYHLTWMHRRHFMENIDKYNWFMYIEDDMDIPYDNFVEYTKNFKLLWPKYIPSFVRLEGFNGKEFITDVTEHVYKNVIELGGKQFMTLSTPYHAFWIMPQKELKETLTKNFVRVETSRELAASYPMWELKKTPLVMIENGQISPLCYSYHLPNNYATDSWTPFAKIEINKLII